ncbi:MAG: hypothetical protein M1833_002048 [Piccolia ochrophora]|nr:MAG: hypothetical protein M1833_002048 [Piccolia ochrophora]
MPIPKLFRSSNRSQGSIEHSGHRPSPSQSPLPSPSLGQHAFVGGRASGLSNPQEPVYSAAHPLSPAPERDEPFVRQYQPTHDEDAFRGHNLSPTRSQSQRYSTSAYSSQHSNPHPHVVGGPRDEFAAEEPQASPDLHDDGRPSYPSINPIEQQAQVPAPAPALPEQKKSKKGFFSFSHSSRDHQHHSASDVHTGNTQPVAQGNVGGVSRKISLRRKDPPPRIRQVQYSPTEGRDQHGWHSPGESISRLPLNEESEEGLDSEQSPKPEVPSSPPVPLKDTVNYRPAIHHAATNEGIQSRPLVQRGNSDTVFSEHSRNLSHDYLPQQTNFQPTPQFPPPPGQHLRQYQPYHPNADDYYGGRLTPESHRRLDTSSPGSFQQIQEDQFVQQQYARQQSAQQYDPYNQQPQLHSDVSLTEEYSQPPQDNMAPAGQPGQSRQSTEDNRQGSQGGSSRDGPPLSAYRESSQAGNTQHSQGHGQRQNVTGQGQTMRGGPPGQQGANEPGRSSSPLVRHREEPASAELAAFQELQQKYSKVKKLYFEKLAQVEQLQNTVAHQRLSSSRTSLDDNEYATRFNRLDGAINNVAFTIRKDWKAIPPWLQPIINQDACIKGTKEMTVVGRACISRWIVDEIFERFFHPAIEPTFSAQLKIIEKNIRRFAPPIHSLEDEDSLLAKVSHWRLTTVDGLQDALSKPQAMEYRTQLTASLVDKLTASLQMNLNDPPPPGLEGGVGMIVELAVGIAANLPLESREVFVNYPMPGSLFSPDNVKIEAVALPPLTNPGSGEMSNNSAPHDATDKSSLSGGAAGGDASSQTSDPKDQSSSITGDESSLKDVPSQQQQQQQHQKKERKPGILSSFKRSAQPDPPPPPPAGPGAIPGQSKPGASGSQISLTQPSQAQQQQQRPGSAAGGAVGMSENEPPRVRVAGFMTVEVRGRSVLVKAPIWTL